MKTPITYVLGFGNTLFRIVMFNLPTVQVNAQTFLQRNNVRVPEMHKGKKVAQWKTESRK